MNKTNLFKLVLLSLLVITSTSSQAMCTGGSCCAPQPSTGQTTPSGLTWFLNNNWQGALMAAFIVGPFQHFINNELSDWYKQIKEAVKEKYYNKPQTRRKSCCASEWEIE